MDDTLRWAKFEMGKAKLKKQRLPATVYQARIVALKKKLGL